MIVDLENYKIKYKLNDKDYGIAFSDIPRRTYKIALFLYECGSSVQTIN